MKKFSVMIMAFIFLIGTTVPGFAQLRNDIGSCKGRVTDIFYETSQIVVNEYATRLDRTFKVTPDILRAAQKGAEAVIIFKKDKSDVAKTVKFTSAGTGAAAAVKSAAPVIKSVVPAATVNTSTATSGKNVSTVTKPPVASVKPKTGY